MGDGKERAGTWPLPNPSVEYIRPVRRSQFNRQNEETEGKISTRICAYLLTVTHEMYGNLHTL